MIYTISGELVSKKSDQVVINVGGLGFKISIPESAKLPALKEKLQLFTYLHVRENALDLFGFLSEDELRLFESLISVNGVGPRSALSIMGVANYKNLVSAINEGKGGLISKAAGIGKKTAERISLELRGKLGIENSARTVSLLEADLDLIETLISLGYSKSDAQRTVAKIDPKITVFKERLKEALKNSNNRLIEE